MARTYSVGEVARIAHVTVRLLHHYDAIGLVVPSRRGRAGYREYDEDDLRRLQRVVLLRELGLSLEAIGALVDGRDADLRATLATHRDRLRDELDRRHAVLRALEAALATHEGETLTMDKLFEGTEHFDLVRHQEEARERWGDTDAYRESMRRTRGYDKADWARLETEVAPILSGWAALLSAGAAPDAVEARALAERHRLHIDRWFYPCDRAHHARLAELYVSDARFAAYFDRHAPGLTAFVAAAIRANADAP